jgi:hypothetical protein
MDPADAAKLAAERGFRDVEPEDCWADWHRLRVELTGNGFLPKLVLCMLGDAGFGERAAAILGQEGIEHEVQPRDPRMPRAFAASAFRVDPSFTPDDDAAIAQHESVVYFLSENFGAGAALEVTRRMLGLAGQLFEVGGTAMKCESSGIAHGRARWLEHIQSGDVAALLAAFVSYPIGDGNDLYSCGMHLLGRPDLIVSDQVVSDAHTAAALFATFSQYLLLECTPGQFASGHTFRVDDDAARHVVRWEPCTGYDEDDFFFNPFGRYRFHVAPPPA